MHKTTLEKPLSLLVCCLCFTAIRRAEGLPAPLRLNSGWQLQVAGQVSGSGEQISKADYQPAGWYRARVPGTILTSLVDDQIFPEPLYGENNRPDNIPDSLCRSSYWYRTTFTPPRSFSGKQLWLKFYGINYLADVWVNGREVGTIKGAFIRGIFNVTSLAHVGRPNALAVRVFPEPHPGKTHEKTIAAGTGRNGGVTGLDGPTFLCTIGWDWIPTIRDRDSGIWQDVTLSATGPVVLEDPYVTSKLPLPRTDSADVTVQTTVRNVTEAPQSAIVAGGFDSVTMSREVSLGPNETRTVTFSPDNTPPLRIDHPRLWWPNGYGPQNLHKLRLTASVDGALSDRREANFGIREITYSLPGSDNLALSVNGVPVMAKGGDWGIDEAMKRISPARLDAMVHMHQIAHYTMIRNWVGQSTSEYLYDACDKYGILLWDEFFEPHPLDGPIPQDVPLYLANVKDKILRFRNHPSIALWCARNEGNPPPKIGEGIQKLINEFDPVRLYQPSSTSGRGVNSGGPYHWRTPREFYSYSAAFKTEIGSISVPTLEAIHHLMPRKDWETINDDWAEHDFCAGAQAGDQYPFIISSRYGPPANLADFVRKAQLANYECFRAMYEGRFAKLFKPETGVITWMSSPAQPSFVWQLYSHDLEPNAALYATRLACEQIHIQMNQNNWHVMVINNTPRPLHDVLAKATVYDMDGTPRWTKSQTVTAKASAATEAGTVEFAPGLSPVHFVKLELFNAEHRLLSQNFYWRAAKDDPDNFIPLLRMPSVALDVHARRRRVPRQCVLEVTVSNPTKTVALLAHFQLRRCHSGRRVLPVFYSDNYISLLPGETRHFTVEAARKDLAGEAPMLTVDGWNVTVQPSGVGAGGIAVMPNTEAQVSAQQAAQANTGPRVVASINCGGDPYGVFQFGSAPVDVFERDFDFHGGSVAHSGEAIDNTGVPNAAPVAIYSTERWGPCTYTIPVNKGSYTVRLHFAETKFGSGERKFNVAINGRRVLSNFDIAAEAGKDKALVKDFPSIHSDKQANVVISFTRGSAGQPKICAIQVLKD